MLGGFQWLSMHPRAGISPTRKKLVRSIFFAVKTIFWQKCFFLLPIFPSNLPNILRGYSLTLLEVRPRFLGDKMT